MPLAMTTLPAAPVRTRRFLADHNSLPMVLVGDPAGLHFRFHPGGRLHSVQDGAGLMINLRFGCPLAGGLHRLHVEIEGGGRRQVHCVIGAGSGASFSANSERAEWRLGGAGFAVTAVLTPDRARPGWLLAVTFENSGPDDLCWRAFHGIDVGLTSPGAARINEAYASQYIDHRAFDHAVYGKVVASRQNLPADARHPVLLQACLSGCSEFATDAGDVFGGPIERSGGALPLFLRPGGAPLPGVRQGESSYVALRSRMLSAPTAGTSRCDFAGIYSGHHPEATNDSCLSWLDQLPCPPVPAREPCPSANAPRSIFDLPAVVHGEPMDELALKKCHPGEWDLIERSPAGKLWSFFTGPEARHVVLRSKEAAMGKPHATILRSGAGIAPEPAQITTTCFAAGIFNSLLSAGHTSFHRLFSYPREYHGLLATAGQRIWVQDDSSWQLLGVPSFFEMGLRDVRWRYVLKERTIEVRVGMDSGRCQLEIGVVSGPETVFLVTHGLIGGINEYDEPAELEIDEENASVKIRAAAGSPIRTIDAAAAFKIAACDPSAVAEIGGAECLEGGAPGHAMLVIRTEPVRHFRLEMSAASGLRTAGGNGPCGDWVKMATGIGVRGPSLAARRLSCILPWFVHNGMIHYSVPHGIEQYNGGAWGTRDVTQGSVEMLLALGRTEECRRVLLDVYSHQYEERHDWPQWFMLAPFGHIQQSHSHGDIPLWPLKALCDYLEATADFGILDEPVPWSRAADGAMDAHPSPLIRHLEANIGWLRANCRPGTALLRYNDGDWDDSLQPAKPEFRNRLVSSWTVALCHQVLRRLEDVSRRSGRTLAGLEGFAEEVRRDFHRLLVIDGVVCGFFLFDSDSADSGKPLLHPSDRLTGISYRLIPMTRSILAELFTPGEAELHHRLIREHLMAADGVRLMDRPPVYKGGVPEVFQRAESSPSFSREIGLMYTHAHLRYVETMASLGRADDMLEAMNQANPAGLCESVPHALPRQSNAYFSSSDAVVRTRYEASDRYGEIRAGKIPVEGGWRIYSSGPGIFLNLLVARMAGIRRHYDRVILDPVLPKSLDGLEVLMPWGKHELRVIFSVKTGCHSPRSAALNGTALDPLGHSPNPYRKGGWELDATRFDSLMQAGENRLEVCL